MFTRRSYSRSLQIPLSFRIIGQNIWSRKKSFSVIIPLDYPIGKRDVLHVLIVIASCYAVPRESVKLLKFGGLRNYMCSEPLSVVSFNVSTSYH